MGCDYYVYTYLEIKHREGLSYIELDRMRSWYCDCLEPNVDSDDEEENYEKYCFQYVESFLKPAFEPIMIYDGSKFLKQRYIEKYLNLIHEKTLGTSDYWRDEGKLLDVNHINQIRKIEIRESA